jgi:hypothetical protein
MSGKWKHWRTRLIVTFATLTLAWLIVPAPVSGYWHTPLTDCLCHSTNLLRFEDGQSLEWATGHRIHRQVSGRYEKAGYWYVWDHGDEVHQIKPGWFLMRIKSVEGQTWGWRELNWKTIRQITEVAR